MNKAKKGNRPLILSIISIMLCTLLLIGSTIAWFTDTETNKGNVIQAGDLDVDVVWYEIDESKESNFDYTITNAEYEKSYSFTFSNDSNDFDNDEDDAMISSTNWQSGDYDAKLIKVTNNGSLDVDITLNAVVEDLGLQDALWYDFIQVDSASTTETGSFDVRAMSSLSEFVSSVPFSLDGTTEDGTADTLEFILIYGMFESADNTYQNTGYSADIFLTATQKDEKNTVIYVSTIDDIKAITSDDEDKTVILLSDITDTDYAVNFAYNLNFDLNGYKLTVKSFKMYTTDYCTVDFDNGQIIAASTDGNIDIQIPYGTINADDTIFAAASDEKIIIDASNNTVNIMGTTDFVATTTDGVTGETIAGTTSVQPSLLSKTTVNMSGDNEIIFTVADGEGVTINNTSTTGGSASATGTGADNVTMLEDGEVPVLTASEQFIADLKNAVTGDTVTLTDDVEINANLYIFDKAINIDLNQFDLTINGVFVLDYSSVTTETGKTYSIGNGTFASYSSGRTTFTETEQTGTCTVDAVIVYATSEFATKNFYVSYGAFGAEEFYFGGIGSDLNYGYGGTYLEEIATGKYDEYLADDTTIIGTLPTTD